MLVIELKTGVHISTGNVPGYHLIYMEGLWDGVELQVLETQIYSCILSTVVILVEKAQTFSKESNTYYMTSSAEKILFHVFSRSETGTVSAKKLRKQGKVIGNVYGLSMASEGVYMDKNAIKKLYASHGDTGLIYLQIGDSKKQVPVLIAEYETDPFGNEILHVAFRRVDLSDPIKADVSVYLIGEADIPEAVVSLVKDFITVEALPADLPDRFEIDISELSEVGQSISLADIKLDSSKVTLILDEDEKPEDITLVIVQAIAGEVAETETPETQDSQESAEDSQTQEPAKEQTPQE